MSFLLLALNDLCERKITLINPKSQDTKDFWYIDISAIDNTTKRITSPLKVNSKSASVRARQLVQQGDVIVSTMPIRLPPKTTKCKMLAFSEVELDVGWMPSRDQQPYCP